MGEAVATRGRAAVIPRAAMVSRRVNFRSDKTVLRSGGRERADGFDVQAIALNAGDSDPFADGCGTAPGAPFAIADADSADMFVHCADHRHDLSDEPRGWIVQQRTARWPIGVEAAPGHYGNDCVKREQGELWRRAEIEQLG